VIRAASEERLEPPRPLREQRRDAQAPRVLAHRPGFEWAGRPSTAYKDARDLAQALAFKGVRRVELVGKFGERSRTDLRYFEIEPGGYSSLEKHLHAHVVIGARGRGVLVLGSRREPLSPMDVACIGPLEPHQLRNESSEPFGFFCIVDHDRDRPEAP